MTGAQRRILHSSKSVEYPTPQAWFDYWDKEFGFTLDPCSTHENAKCKIHFTKAEDGLKQDWGDHIVFINPPYGREIGKWVRRAYEASKEGATCVLLLPSRTGTSWWSSYVLKGEVRFIRGRLTFANCTNPAPFDSVLVIFRPSAFRLSSCEL